MPKLPNTPITIDLRVNPILKEYIISTTKSDTLRPTKWDTLWLLVKQHLIVGDGEDVIPEGEKSEIIKIELLELRGSKACTRQTNQRKYRDPALQKKSAGQEITYIDTLFRNKLSETGQRVIYNFLYRQFKESFLTFMMAQKLADPNRKPRAIIRDFLDLYEISEDSITEAMLVKSWQRDWRYLWLKSRQRKLVVDGTVYCGAIV